jgi:hypothetical protein
VLDEQKLVGDFAEAAAFGEFALQRIRFSPSNAAEVAHRKQA